jgi:succinate dehydrogenase / fumarate reductase, cytochrome b subunit
MKKPRPVWFSPLAISFPIGGVVSLLHRLSALLLFFSLPLVLYGFYISLKSHDTYQLITINYGIFLKLIVWIVSWALAHHVLAGIRFLLMDVGLCKDLASTRRTAKWALWGSVLAALALLGVWLC